MYDTPSRNQMCYCFILCSEWFGVFIAVGLDILMRSGVFILL